MSAAADPPAGTAADAPPVLRNPDVVLYLVARFLWMAAVQIGNVAVGWHVYAETRSALALGLVGLAAFVPKVAVTLFAGVVADRYERRTVLALCLFVNGLAGVGLLLAVLAPTPMLGVIYALFVVSGTARGFALPVMQSLAPTLVPRAQFSRVVSLASSISQFAAIAGPALGGVLYVFGTAAPFAVAAASFFAAGVLTRLIRPRRTGQPRGPFRLADAFAGLHFIRRRPVILGAVSLDMFAVLLGGVTALLPIVASEVLHVGPAGLGLLRAMPAVGAMTVGLVIAWAPIRRRAGAKLFVATVVFGLATIGFGLSQTVWLSAAFLWVIGAADVVSVVIRHTLVQADTPDEMRGRVAAVNALFLGASNELGEFESGVTAALFGLVPAILIGGAGTVAIAAAWAVLFPALRRRDALVTP